MCQIKENQNSVENKQFISSGILLEMARDEYTKERERANALDNKASFFITIIIAVATIFVPIIPFGKIVRFYQKEYCTVKCIATLWLIILLLASIVIIVAFRKLYDAYKLTDYKRPSLDCISVESNHMCSNEQLNKGLCDHYKTVVDDNYAVNERKCKSISEGLKLCGVGFFMLIVSTIGMIVVVGG